jgi:phosphoglycolate phosphatase-like HAD superfamily hydrolase
MSGGNADKRPDAIRREIGIAQGPILEAIAKMDSAARRDAEVILLRHEWDAANNGALYEGAVATVAECRARGYGVAILTRNARTVVDYILAEHGFVVDAIRTREDGAIKPSPEPVLSICRELQADPTHSWMVGDYLFDILSGKAAGTRTALMIGDSAEPDYAIQADYVIRSLSELLTLIP